MQKHIDLALVIPAYKAGGYIKEALKKKIVVLDKLQINYQIVLVIDGIDENTLDQINEFRDKDFISIVEQKANMGKGYSVRHGMSLVKARYIGYMDVDNDINPKIIEDMYLNIVDSEYNAIIPSKFAKGSFNNFPIHRSLISRVYILLVRIFFGLSFTDIQLGAKMYSADLLSKVLSQCHINGFAFEIEMLAIASKLKVLRYKEIPVSVDLKTKSTIKLKDGLMVLFDTLKVFIRLLSINANHKEN